MKRPRETLVLAASLLGSAATAAADAPKEPAAPQAEVVSVGDDRLIISVPKWTSKQGEKNIGLEVRFSWKDPPSWRTAVTKDAGTDWVVVFPDRPEVGTDVAKLEFVYRFTLTDARRNELLAATNHAVLVAVDSVVAALRETNATGASRKAEFAKVMKSKLQAEILPAFASTERFATETGTSARDVILERVGFTQNTVKEWSLELGDLGSLSDIEGLARSLETTGSGLSTIKKQLPTPDPANASKYDEACRAALQASWETVGVQSGLAVIDSCGEALSAQESRTATAVGVLRTSAKRFAAADYKNVDELNASSVALSSALGSAVRSVPADGQAALMARDTFKAVAFGIQSLTLARLEQLKLSSAKDLTETIVEQRLTLRKEEQAHAILKLEARRRMYDAATGFVYVAVLDDFIVPTVLSVCPWGCLKTDKGTDDYVSLHSWSVDIGVKALVLDGNVDPRHDGALGILFGGSWNPIDVVRASLGLYMFENTQTAEWNLAPYAGISVNVLHAGELLGVLGVKSVPKAEIIPE